MLIEFTQKHVTLSKRNIGEFINLEVDHIGKYVENVVKGILSKTTNNPLEPFIERCVENYLTKKSQNQ